MTTRRRADEAMKSQTIAQLRSRHSDETLGEAEAAP